MVIPFNKRIPNLPPYSRGTDDNIDKDQTFQVVNDVVNVINNITTTIISNGTTTISPVTTAYPAGSVVIKGLQPPSFTTAQIATLEPEVGIGTMWYNSTLKKLQFKSDTGVVETITSVP